MEIFKCKQAAFLSSICLKMPVSPNSSEIPRTAGLIFQLTSVSELNSEFLNWTLWSFFEIFNLYFLSIHAKWQHFDMYYIKCTCNKPCIPSNVYEHHRFSTDVEQLPVKPMSRGYLSIPVQVFLPLLCSSSWELCFGARGFFSLEWALFFSLEEQIWNWWLELGVSGLATRTGKHSLYWSSKCLISDTLEVEPVWLKPRSRSNTLGYGARLCMQLWEHHWGCRTACATLL